jgi:ERF superfamily protein
LKKPAGQLKGETMSETSKNVELFNEPLPIERNGSGALMDVIARAAADPHCDVAKMEKLLAMHERLEARTAEQQFNEAMNLAQHGIRAIAADASNPQTKSKYASYVALDKALRPVYTANGFALSFDTGDAPEGHVRVLCYVSHKAGHSRTYKIDMPADGKGAKGGDVMTRTHATGAAITYGQRYLLKAIFNIAVGDDTDNGAEGVTGPIDASQLQHVRDLIEKSGANAEAFCKHFHIEAVPDLPAKEFSKAVEMLNLKARTKK